MRKLSVLIFCMSMLMLVGCSYQEKDNHKSQEVLNQVKEDIIVDTQYYSITLPSHWEEAYGYEIKTLTSKTYELDFYEKESFNENETGFLFSIQLYLKDKDYSYLSNHKHIGNLKVGNITYKVVVTFPKKVQYKEENANLYRRLSHDIDSIMKTIKAKEGYRFIQK